MSTAMQTCYRHGDRRAGVVCQRCDRPICPDCMQQASVGFHCPECTRQGAQRVYRPHQLPSRRPVVTTALVAVNVAVFVWGIGAGLATRDEVIFDGGLLGRGIEVGEWWRIVTSGFLHANLIHVGFNCFILYQLGLLLEPVLGRLKFSLVYAVSLLSGALGVLLLDPDVFTVGASGAVFGLMGAALALMRSRGVDPFSTGLGGVVILNLVITFAVPGISIGGHVGGLVGGLVVGALLSFPLAGLQRTPWATQAIAAALGIGVWIACLNVI